MNARRKPIAIPQAELLRALLESAHGAKKGTYGHDEDIAAPVNLLQITDTPPWLPDAEIHRVL